MTAVNRKRLVQLDSRELDDSVDGVFLHTRVGDQVRPGEPGSPVGMYLGTEIDLSRMGAKQLREDEESMMVDLSKEAEAAVFFGFFSLDRQADRRPSVQETRWAGSEQGFYRPPLHLSKVFRRSVDSRPRTGRKDAADRSSTPECSSRQQYKTHRSEALSRNWHELTTNTVKHSQYSRDDIERLYRASKRSMLSQKAQAQDGYNKLLETRIRAAHKVIQQTESMKVATVSTEKTAQSVFEVPPPSYAVGQQAAAVVFDLTHKQTDLAEIRPTEDAAVGRQGAVRGSGRSIGHRLRHGFSTISVEKRCSLHLNIYGGPAAGQTSLINS